MTQQQTTERQGNFTELSKAFSHVQSVDEIVRDYAAMNPKKRREHFLPNGRGKEYWVSNGVVFVHAGKSSGGIYQVYITTPELNPLLGKNAYKYSIGKTPAIRSISREEFDEMVTIGEAGKDYTIIGINKDATGRFMIDYLRFTGIKLRGFLFGDDLFNQVLALPNTPRPEYYRQNGPIVKISNLTYLEFVNFTQENHDNYLSTALGMMYLSYAPGNMGVPSIHLTLPFYDNNLFMRGVLRKGGDLSVVENVGSLSLSNKAGNGALCLAR
ncbi:MAG: hypothetical protein ABIG89_05440 [Candidatus Woesearchaeota archaeon]